MTDSGRISLSRTDLSEVIRHLDFAWQEFSSMPQQKYVGRAGTIKRLSAKLAKVLDRARPQSRQSDKRK